MKGTFGWRIVTPAAASASILLIILIALIIRRCYHSSKRGTKVSEANRVRLFSWDDHPSLIADAVENGWSRFAFTNCYSTPSTTRSPLPEITWEVGQNSVEFMQKIRMNPGVKKLSLNCSVIGTGLPLPGPPIGNPCSFPQEAYFEISVLCLADSGKDRLKSEGEKTNLIGDGDGLAEIKMGEKGIWVGLTCSNLVPIKIPGSCPGSIGFHSDGSVYLDGMKLGYESEKEEWGQEGRVIGCGYDPRHKKVFFTVDAKLVEAIHCISEEFGSPLYPVIAANVETTLVVNMGQCGFLYEPANEHRNQNPCFLGPVVRSRAAIGFEDSGELFSMGRLDSAWQQRCNTESSTNNGDDSDADLFEIVLDVDDGKSAHV